MAPDDSRRAAYRAEKDALQALLELDATARINALDALRVRDAALADVVARRLALSDAPPIESGAAAAPRIPRYTVQHEIGRGGMGRVWLAQRADAADTQRLAIKQVRSDIGDEELLRRFEAERRILSRLDHPHIVPLLDAGRDADGRPFLVTAFIEGEPIDAWCRRTGPNVAARVRLVRDIVAALAHAHRQLIVHRDLKPANVLVDGEGRVRLLDFGIAKMLDAAPDVTAAGTSLMTLRYAAPEQVNGGNVGVGCDLYAVGVLLYELLAGHSPYGEQREPAALLHSIVHEDAPALPSTSTRGEVLPRDLRAIVAMLLRKRPEERFLSAEALGDELDRWLGGRPVSAMRGQRGYIARRWLQRHWPWVAGALLLLGIGAFHAYRLDRELAATARERDKAQSVADYFVALFHGATPSAARSGDISARELLERGVARLTALEQGPHSPQALAALLMAVSRVHADLGLHAQALDLSLRAVAALRDADDPLALAEALRGAASTSYALDRKDEYLARSREALAVLEKAGETDNNLYPRLLANIGLGHFMHGDYERAWPVLARSRDLLRARLPESRGDYVLSLTNSGGLASIAGNQQLAETLLLEAETEVRLLEPRDIDQELFIARNLAMVLRDSDRLDEARRRFDAIIERSTEFYGTGHPGLISAFIGRGETELGLGDLAAAARDFTEARHQGETTLAPGHGQLLDIDGLHAIVQVTAGEFEPAITTLERIAAQRGDETIVEAQPRLEAVALARARCNTPDGRAELEHSLAELRATANIAPWHHALADGWARDCAVAAPR